MLLALLLACPSETTPDDTTDPTTDTTTDTTDTTTDTTDTTTAPVDPPVVDGITLAPHERVQTVLVVDWTQDRDADLAWLTWEFEGAEHASPARAVAKGAGHEVILGLPGEVTVPVSLHLTLGADEFVIPLGDGTTGKVPVILDPPQLDVRDEVAMRPEPYLLTSVDVGNYPFFGPCFTVVLDNQGRVVWYRRTSGSRLTWQPRVSEIGAYVLIDETTYYSGGTPTVSRVTLDLERDEAVEVADIGVAYDEMEDGSILFGEDLDGKQFYLTRQYPDGTRERVWDCLAWDPGAVTWDCNPNTVDYDPTRGSALWSMFQTDRVVEVDVTTGEVLRVFGDHPDAYAFDPAESSFELQHFPNYTPSGKLMVSTHSPDETEQWARAYEVDDATQTLTEVWSVESPYWAQYAGQLQELPSGNVLWQLGVTGVVHELETDGTVVWQVRWPGHLVGNATPLADLYALTER